jgi:hypothetical protein
METTGAAEAKQATLPDSATITICDQKPSPNGEVEVTPNGGRVHFENKDDNEYRLRLWKAGSESLAGIDILLPAGGRVSVIIKRDDEFQYSVVDIIDKGSTGNGGGPIRN